MSESVENATQGVTETVDTVPQPATDDNASQTGAEQQADTQEQTPPEPEPKRKPWFQERIDELTRARREAERQRDAVLAQLRSNQQQPEQYNAPQNAAPPGYVPVAEVARIAEQQLAAAAFTEACNSVAAAGEAAFPDFQTAVSNFQMIGGPPEALLEAVTALGTEEGARAFYELGKNPDEAMRISRLSPARMAVEVARLAAKPMKLPPVSKAPEPIKPLTSGAARSVDPDHMTDEQFRKWIAKELNG